MSDRVTITALETERFKRLKLVHLEFTPEGLFVIGGRNGEGKTSVLNSIVYLLGGEKYRPSEMNNGDAPPDLKLKLSNGIIVERKGKNAKLKVTDPNGLAGGQGVLDKFVEQLALDLPKFMEATDKKKAEILLQIIGAGDELKNLDEKEKDLYEQRRDAGKASDHATAELEGLTHHADAPTEHVPLVELVEEIERGEGVALERSRAVQDLERMHGEIKGEQVQISQAQERISDLELQAQSCEAFINGLTVPDVEPLRAKMATLEDDQAKIRANQEYSDKTIEANDKKKAHKLLEEDIAAVREERAKLLDGVDMPLEGLSVAEGELVYNNARWDCMSGADQLMVATSIVKQLNPECGFVLIDKLEQMDLETMKEFGAWATAQNLQIIATRVSTGDECSIVIEDGSVLSGSAS